MNEVIQAIFIHETQIRNSPKPHIVYKIEVHAAVRNWVVWKRYSEFYKLDSQLHTMFPKQPPPYKLPAKHYFPSTFTSPDRVEERRRGLEDYLRAILSNRDDRWRLTNVWKEFLAIPSGRALDTAYYTSESWLDDYNSMQNTAREIRALINKKTTHMARNEISASHNCTMQAKKLLVTLSSRLTNLEGGLVGLGHHGSASLEGGMSEGELRRRQDMLTTLKDERDALMKLATTGRQPDQDLLYKQKPTNGFPSIQQQKQELLKRSSTGRRAFGTAALERQKAQETEMTRGLDNDGLLTYQNQIMSDQDQQIQQFGAILARQKQLGIAIGHELETQNQILDELDSDVDRTQTKLKFANKKLQKIK
ncbi:Phox homologous domain-containing protein [Cokeromyces recurvatus]|uniref:Phox homologous domain-containing protein n=1 Tax=Cokeromyces recurvatus TaxID=90255 RepID=UPI00221F6135|nr:Phox homologous domain-containing protein [Cokeromyces recurvatus]KAI7898037.1 Phox homologous domain-containing protein [Cokeromyces recurvatus]